MKRPQQGFTLIELIIVIVVLGVLAATALPRFVNLGRDARIAKLNGALASVKSAAALAHAASRTGGGAHNAPVAMQGQSITMVNHYPTANTAGILAAAQISAAEGFSFSGEGDATTPVSIRISDASDPTTCAFTYTNATETAPPTYSTPVTTGC